jgi:hypothetical protein
VVITLISPTELVSECNRWWVTPSLRCAAARKLSTAAAKSQCVCVIKRAVKWVGCKSRAPSVVHLSAIRARRGKWWYHLEHMGPSRFERMRNGSSRSKYSFETANESRPICLCVCRVGTPPAR